MRIEAAATTTRSPPSRPRSAREARHAGAHRIGGSRGLQGIAAEPPPPRAIVVGHRWDASCAELRRFLDRNQVTFRWITPDAPDAAEQWGGAAAGRRRTARRSASSAARPWSGRSCAASPSCSASAPRPQHAEYDTVIVGAGPAGPGGRRLRRVGGPADDRGRARGARRPGRHLLADRELPRLPLRRLGRRAREPRAAAGAAARRRDPRHPLDHADRRRDPPGPPRRRRRPAGAHDHPRLRRRVAAACRSTGSTGSPGRASPTARRAARRRTRTASTSTSSAPATRPARRRCSSPTHARSVTILCRGDGLEKSMSRYLVDQLADALEHPTLTPQAEVIAGARRRRRSRRSTSATRRPAETTRLESGGLFIFIGADAETAWLPPEIALDAQRLRAHRPRHARRGALDARPRPLPARDERPGHLRLRRRPLRPGQARRRGGRRGQHGDRLRAPVPQGRPGGHRSTRRRRTRYL